MNFELSEEQQMYRRAVREFVERELKSIAAHTDESAEFPWAAVRKGIGLGILCPKSMAGLGWMPSAPPSPSKRSGEAAARRVCP
jgi:alkylation response protein AidB-like acyl-CoA dehydrogenase